MPQLKGKRKVLSGQEEFYVTDINGLTYVSSVQEVADLVPAPSEFVLSDGNGTTANGTAVDLGGTASGTIAFQGGSWRFGGPTTEIQTFSVLAENTLGISLVGGGDIVASETYGELALISNSSTLAWYNISSQFINVELMPSLKSGVSQVGAGAAANELWRDTADNSIKIGV
jgi:hypothetical protein